MLAVVAADGSGLGQPMASSISELADKPRADNVDVSGCTCVWSVLGCACVCCAGPDLAPPTRHRRSVWSPAPAWTSFRPSFPSTSRQCSTSGPRLFSIRRRGRWRHSRSRVCLFDPAWRDVRDPPALAQFIDVRHVAVFMPVDVPPIALVRRWELGRWRTVGSCWQGRRDALCGCQGRFRCR